MKKIDVTICIPVYNRESLVIEAIRSAQHQTVENIEIVVVDNNSDDKTYESVLLEAKRDDRIKLYRNDENIGALRNFYKSICFAESEYVALLGSDDWLEPTFIEGRLEGYKSYPNAALVSGPMKIFEQNEETALLAAKYHYHESIYSLDYVLKNFYKKFLISYFCLFRKKDILSNFKFNYKDPYNWGVYEKGLGLDLINCLNIIEKSKSQYIFYADYGSYCFRNHRLRVSESIISTDNSLAKTIKEFNFNSYMFVDFLEKIDKKYSDKFIESRLNELHYEILRGMQFKIKDFKSIIHEYYLFYKINNINFLSFLKSLLSLPFYTFKRIFFYFDRKIRNKYD